MFDGFCDIRRAGVSPEGLAQLDLKADDGTFDWQWFLSEASISKEVLATALAAVVTGKKLHIQVNTTTAWSRVHRCLLYK
jgi:hypothetical protein